MAVPTEPTGARRVSLLTRMFQLVGSGGTAKEPEEDASPVTPRQQTEIAVQDADRNGRVSPPEQRLYLEARRQIKRRAWGRAQRALEEAAKHDPASSADLDLVSVRTIRRSLKRAARWPSDAEAHLDLGRAYFDLDLGAEALAEFVLVQRLAPKRYEAFALATLEHLYRGDYTQAMTHWTRARALNPELPELEEVMGTLPTR